VHPVTTPSGKVGLETLKGSWLGPARGKRPIGVEIYHLKEKRL